MFSVLAVITCLYSRYGLNNWSAVLMWSIAQWALTFLAILQIFSFRESGENQIEKADDVLQKVEQILNDF